MDGKPTRLVRVVDENHDVLDVAASAQEGVGIFGDDGTEYIAGWDAGGSLYASQVDGDDTVLDFDGCRTGFRLE